MRAPDENGAEDYPEHRGQPPEPQARENRAHYGAGCGNGGEVLSKKQGGLGGNVVDAVVHLAGRSRRGVVHAQLPRKETAVDEVAQGQGRHGP